MRPLETLLLIANLVTLVALAVPRLRPVRWMPYMAVLAPLIAGAQVLVEGARWQMVPAYALAGVLLVVGVPQSSSLTGRRASGDRGTRARPVAVSFGFGAAVVAMVVSAALPVIVPVFRLPDPTGPYAIGTVTYYWVDAARPEIFTSDPDDARELMVQVWYPARPDATSPREPYVEHPEELASAARLLHLPDFVFSHFKYVTTAAVRAASVAEGQPTYPTLIFLSGRTGYRQSNMFQVQELVSHGYIVAGIDQPYAAAGVVFPDGRLKAMDPRMFDPTHPGHPAFFDGVIPFLAQDVRFTLDQLAALNRSDPEGILTGRLDLLHAGIFGVSLGGILAGEACMREPRLRACLVMDAYMSADVVRSGLPQPTMWISRDAETMQQEGWAQVDIDETQTTMRAVYASLGSDGYLVLVPGMFHPEFTDAPLFSALSSVVGLSGPFDPQQAREIVNAYSLAFFDRYLKNEPATLLDGPAQQYPDVLFQSRRARGHDLENQRQNRVAIAAWKYGRGSEG